MAAINVTEFSSFFFFFFFNFRIKVCDLWPRLDLRQADVPNVSIDRTLNKTEVPLLCANTLLEWAIGARYYGLSSQHDKPGHVARVVLDSVIEMFIP